MKEFIVRDRYNREVIASRYAETFGDAVSTMVRDGEDLSWGDFSGRSLRGADLSGGNFYEANWQAADLRGAKLPQAELASGDFYRACLEGADLRGADISFSDLAYANMKRTDLSGADLIDCQVQRLRLDGANLDGADFNGSFLEPRTVIGAGNALDKAILGPFTSWRKDDISQRQIKHHIARPRPVSKTL